MYDEDLVEDSLAFARKLKSSLNAQQPNVSGESDTTQPASSDILQGQTPVMPQDAQQIHPVQPQPQTPAMPQDTQQVRAAHPSPTQVKMNLSGERTAKSDTTSPNLEMDPSDIAKNTNPYHVIDSRSFTYLPKMKAPQSSIPDNHTTNPLRLFLAFIVSTVFFCIGSLVYIFTFDLEYHSSLQLATIFIPLIMMIIGCMLVNKKISNVGMVFLLIWQCVLAYFMFQIAITRAVMGMG